MWLPASVDSLEVLRATAQLSHGCGRVSVQATDKTLPASPDFTMRKEIDIVEPVDHSMVAKTIDSYSRPRVSNDNAYAEALIRTFKYRLGYPYQGFATLEKARDWVLEFVHWYNHEHKHSGLKIISPAERHSGLSDEIMQSRKAVYAAVRRADPNRWSGEIRNWNLPESVWLNPENESGELRFAS
jgi:hypothetical protein